MEKHYLHEQIYLDKHYLDERVYVNNRKTASIGQTPLGRKGLLEQALLVETGSQTSGWEKVCICLEVKSPGKKQVGLLVALSRDLISYKKLILLEKVLDAVVNSSKAETEKTGLETVAGGNGGKSVFFSLKDTDILYISIN